MLWELLCHEGVGHGLVVLHGRAVRLYRDSRGEHVVWPGGGVQTEAATSNLKTEARFASLRKGLAFVNRLEASWVDSVALAWALEASSDTGVESGSALRRLERVAGTLSVLTAVRVLVVLNLLNT